jgi:lipopolysaccharide transport system permease protein
VLEPTTTNQLFATDNGVSPKSTRAAVPEVPLVIIEPGRSWATLDWSELWRHRGLLYFLVLRDLKVRYKQTALGIAWVIMQPLLLTLVFTVFLGMLARVPSDGAPYPLLVYLGLLPWTFFSSSVQGAAGSLTGNAHLITKVYFPRALIPAASLGARLVDFAISFVILAGMMLYYHVPLNSRLVVLPLLIFLVTSFAMGCSILVSAINVKYRDVSIVMPVVFQLWMFVSPVLYPLALIPGRWRTLYSLNPMVGIVEGFRAVVLGRKLNLAALAISSVITIILLVCSSYIFRRVERSFADIV